MSGPSVVGVTVSAPAPVGIQHLRLSPGLNAFYGKNGVGKTRLIREIATLLQNDAGAAAVLDADYRRWLSTAPKQTAPDALIRCGGVHLHRPITGATTVEDDAISRQIRLWVAEVRQTLLDPQALWTRLGLGAEEIDWFLAEGRWFYQPASCNLFLCDPSPSTSPLRDRWAEDDRAWACDMEDDSDIGPDSQGLGKLFRPPDEHDDRPTGWQFGGMNEIGRARFDRLVMPLLPTLGLPEPPDWFAYPFVRVTHETLHRKFDVLTEGALSPGYYKHPGARRWDEVTDAFDPPARHDDLIRALREISLSATEVMADLFEDPPFLSARPAPPRAWFSGEPPIIWAANAARDGPVFALAGLGSAHRRYAEFAFKRAIESWAQGQRQLQGTNPSTKAVTSTFAVIDEPEQALHPAAERHLAQAAAALGDVVIVSTHSTEFLDVAHRAGSVHLVSRQDDGFVQVRPASIKMDPAERGTVADRWGLTPMRLAAMTGVIILVEGPHDQVIIEDWLRPEIEHHRGVVLPLIGVHGLHHLATSDFLLASTDAPLVVCVDNGKHGRLKAVMAGLADATTPAAKHRVISRQIPLASSPEMKQLARLLRSAVDQRCEHRFFVYGFTKRDIAAYLPVQYIDRRFTKWTELDNAYLLNRPGMVGGS